MIRALAVVGLLTSVPAWAVGEHISITGPAHEQLSQTLCISMECGKSGDYTVSSKRVGEKMELKVLGPSGLRLSLSLPVNADGQMANSDAMTASAKLVQAIESPVVKEAAAQKPAAKKKLGKWAKDSKRKLAKPVRLASRKLARG